MIKGRYLFEPPFKDELVSSWIARNALLFGMRPNSLSTLVFESTDGWKPDVDNFLNAKRLETLSQNTGIPIEKIYRMTFFGSSENFYTLSGKTTQVRWVMPLGIKTKRQSLGLQYCPCCLNEDGERVYFRKHWRLGFFTCCLDHHVKLHDRCPNCGSPIDIKWLTKDESQVLYSPSDMAKCPKCRFDFRETAYEIASDEEYRINRDHFNLYQLGYGTVNGLSFNYSNLYFEGVRRLLSFIACKVKGAELYFYLLKKLELQEPNGYRSQAKNLELEIMGIEQRRVGLAMINYLTEDWPRRFIKACRETNTTKNLVFHPYLTYPFWVSDALLFHIQEYRYYVSEEEGKSIMKYFEKHFRKTIGVDQVIRFVNYYFKIVF